MRRIALAGLLAVVTTACVSIQPGSEDPPDAPATGEAPADAPGYPVGGRVIGGPTDVEVDLATSFPRPDSLFGGLIPEGYFKWKEELFEKTGLELGLSYQMVYQHASATRTNTDYAWGGWLLFEAKWEAINRGEDYEGSVIATLDWRQGLGGADPVFFGNIDVGSLWPTDFTIFELGPAVSILYWEQWFKKDRFVLRVGKQLAAQTYDFFRFKDGRTSFTGSAFTAHTSIPHPPFGQAVSFKWWPKEESSLYVLGTLNDMNGDPERIGFDTFFEQHQFFYGLEVGYHWKRKFPFDFDHIHLDVFWADEKDTQPPGFPNQSGGGFKVLGSKQWGRIVGFSSYTYNTAAGGGFGITLARDTVTAGVAFLKPAGIRGEIGIGTVWMHPLNGAVRDQYGGELYWKLLLTPDLWITPGVQLIVDPSFNPNEDFVVIGQFKFRLFF
jgi:hypothetical protein